MKTLLITTFITLFAMQPAWAQCNDVKVNVNGLVCDFCARALEKVFSEHEEVETIHVDLDNGVVTIHLKEGKSLDDTTIGKLITDSGYNVTSMEKGC